jgi:hypothetical protein
MTPRRWVSGSRLFATQWSDFQRRKSSRIMLSQNVWNHLPSDTVSHPRRIPQLHRWENLKAHMVSIPAVFIGFQEAFYENDALRLTVRTNQQSRVESSRVESNQTRKDAAQIIWLTYNGRARECVHANTVESNRVQSSPTSLAESRVLIPHVSTSSVGLQWSGVLTDIERWEMNVERLILLVRDHQAIYDASHCEHRNRDHTALGIG